MTTSKSPRRVIQVAYDAARQALPAHRHKFSPKKFTQHQLLACLALLEVPLLGFAVAPDWTLNAVDRAKAWIGRHGDQFAVKELTVLGALLLTKGLIELLG